MVDKCPTCERDFKGIEDYPLAYVAKFERIEIPADLVLPFYDGSLFVGPDSDLRRERPPRKVLHFFKNNATQKSYICNRWKWSLRGPWNTGHYQRVQQDQKPIVVAKLDPYLETLESLVGEEVDKSQLLPNFKRDGGFKYAFNIPNTAYKLMFDEQERTPAGSRIAELQLMGAGNMGSAFGPIIRRLARVGRLEYEGRIWK